jgi:selenocysteine-specific elongation factor
MEAIAEISLLSKNPLAPGEQSFARIKLPQPALLLPGDRFIIRQFSPVITIGGGTVLDAAPIPRMPGHNALLEVLASGDLRAILKLRIARRGRGGISIAQLTGETGWTQDFIQEQLAPAVSEKRILRTGGQFLDTAALSELQQFILTTLADFHQKNSLVPGIAKEVLREQTKTSAEILNTILETLSREQKIELAGDLVRLPGHGVTLKDEEAESKQKIEQAFEAAGLKVPALHEVLAGLKIDKARAQKIVTLLLRDKVLIKASPELVFHHTALDQLRRQLAAQKQKSTRIDVAQFKELTGVSRKYAIPLLEYLDRERVTRRVGDVREIL